MTFLNTWEDFEKAAERLYLQNPMRVSLEFQMSSEIVRILSSDFDFQARFTTQYDHHQGQLTLKMTDDAVCLQYKSDAAQDVRRMEKFVNNLMRHMASKEAN